MGGISFFNSNLLRRAANEANCHPWFSMGLHILWPSFSHGDSVAHADESRVVVHIRLLGLGWLFFAVRHALVLVGTRVEHNIKNCADVFLCRCVMDLLFCSSAGEPDTVWQGGGFTNAIPFNSVGAGAGDAGNVAMAWGGRALGLFDSCVSLCDAMV